MAQHCFDLETVERFRDRAACYAAARPAYPAAAIDLILRDGAARAVDVGSGTGIGSRLIADRGVDVIAVDPSAEMLRSAAPHPQVTLVQGTAEAIPLRPGAATLMTAFNAFHWFKPAPFFDEVRCVVRGRLAVVWNDWALRDEFTSRFVALMRGAAPPDFPPEDREREVAPLYETKAVANLTCHEFANVHRLDREHLLLRLQSVSYIPKSGPGWEALVRALDALFERYASRGEVEHHYVTRVYIGEVV